MGAANGTGASPKNWCHCNLLWTLGDRDRAATEVTDAGVGQFNLTINDSDGDQAYPPVSDPPVIISPGDTVELNVDINGDITPDTTAGINNGDFTLTRNKEGKRNISLDKAIGNGENANALGNIFNTGEILEGTSLERYFRTIVTSVGAESSRSQQMKNNQDVVLKQLNTLDRSVSGVSLDEEMANLIKYQQSYAAAAKYITKTDELLQTLMTIV